MSQLLNPYYNFFINWDIISVSVYMLIIKKGFNWWIVCVSEVGFYRWKKYTYIWFILFHFNFFISWFDLLRIHVARWQLENGWLMYMTKTYSCDRDNVKVVYFLYFIGWWNLKKKKCISNLSGIHAILLIGNVLHKHWKKNTWKEWNILSIRHLLIKHY